MEVTQNGRSGVPVISHALVARRGETGLARTQLEKETVWIAQLSVLLPRQESVMTFLVHVRTTSILRFIYIERKRPRKRFFSFIIVAVQCEH